jgi:hypothetical protein
MTESVYFEVFKSDRGMFLAFPEGSPVFDADALELSPELKKLTAMRKGLAIDFSMPKLSTELADVLASGDRLFAVAFALGGITLGISLPLTVRTQ